MLNEFRQSETMQKSSLPQEKKKKKNDSSITSITTIADKKIECSVNICGAVFHFYLRFKLDNFFSRVLFSVGIDKRCGKKVNLECN